MLPVVICAVAGSALNNNATRHAQTTLRVDLTIIELLPLRVQITARLAKSDM